ncbi:MAG: SDR family mycofactocin-dependent oxidoreductase [Cellvibrionales bacterium]|nr:MAG: SDR family mycofactocin-dependent oxidoreductase [Cellvibrionales bacterium]
MTDNSSQGSGKLVGKTAFVTGGARGIGHAMALRLAEEGANVAIMDVASGEEFGAIYRHASSEDAERAEAEIAATGRQVLSLTGDVRKSADLANAIDQTVAELGGLDIVVCNAGVLAPAVSWELPEEQWDYVTGVDLKGVWLTTKYAIPHMIEQDRGGRIIILSSVGGLRASVGNIAYTASKFGVVGIAQSLAQEVGKYGITVNTIHPGTTDTELLRAIGEDKLPYFMEQSVLGKLLEPRDIANAVAWLASEEARYVTGHTMVVDAGFLVKTS